jgi:transcriptional regulator with XRE-family HTH domain
MTSHKLTLRERIENRIVYRKDCWFTDYTHPDDKPRIQINGKNYLLSRVVYEVFKGEAPGKLLVCHTCNNSLCINPDHLCLRTSADNMKNKKEKNRQVKGSAIPNSKLTENTVIEIRDLLIEGKLTFKEIGDRFGIGSNAISEINSGKAWSHVEGIGNKLKTKISTRKLEEKHVKRIKKHLSNGIMDHAEISGLFGVSRKTISDIEQNKTWSHVKLD